MVSRCLYHQWCFLYHDTCRIRTHHPCIESTRLTTIQCVTQNAANAKNVRLKYDVSGTQANSICLQVRTIFKKILYRPFQKAGSNFTGAFIENLLKSVQSENYPSKLISLV